MITGVIKKTSSLSGNMQYRQSVNGNISGFIGDIAGDKTYEFTQNIASNTWSINHQLNKYPSVMVIDSGNNVVVGDILYIDKNNITLTFSAPFSGKAYCN